jgi:hypothetical protein
MGEHIRRHLIVDEQTLTNFGCRLLPVARPKRRGEPFSLRSSPRSAVTERFAEKESETYLARGSSRPPKRSSSSSLLFL